MRWFGVIVLALAACEGGQREPVSAPAPTLAVPAVTPVVVADASSDAANRAPSSDMINHELVDMQTQLGSAASTCAGTAKLLANQGDASAEKLRLREQRILKLCVNDRWPEAMRFCVAEATHDPMSCTDNLTTPRQKANWNAVFESW